MIEVTVQDAYLSALMEKDKTIALDIYSEMSKRKLAKGNAVRTSVAASTVIATNNLAVLRGERKDLSDSRRRIERLMERGDNAIATLTEKEQRVVKHNRTVLLLHANKFGASKTAIDLFEKAHPDSKELISLRATLLLREGKTVEAQSLITDYLYGKESNVDDSILLLQAQISSVTGAYETVISSLGSLSDEDVRYSPTVVATMSQAYQKLEDHASADEVLDKAASWWTSSMREDQSAEKSTWAILLAAADSYYSRGQFESAAKYYGILKDRVHSGAIPQEFEKAEGQVLLGYMRSMSMVDLEEAKSFAEELPNPLGHEVIDADNLERSFRGGLVHARENLGSKERKAKETYPQSKKKRKKKIRYPKNFDPSNPGPPPDPERWLPKKERSSFKKKGQRRKDKESIRGAQGAVLTTRDEKAAEESPHTALKAQEMLLKGKGKGKRRSGKK